MLPTRDTPAAAAADARTLEGLQRSLEAARSQLHNAGGSSAFAAANDHLELNEFATAIRKIGSNLLRRSPSLSPEAGGVRLGASARPRYGGGGRAPIPLVHASSAPGSLVDQYLAQRGESLADWGAGPRRDTGKASYAPAFGAASRSAASMPYISATGRSASGLFPPRERVRPSEARALANTPSRAIARGSPLGSGSFGSPLRPEVSSVSWRSGALGSPPHQPGTPVRMAGSAAAGGNTSMLSESAASPLPPPRTPLRMAGSPPHVLESPTSEPVAEVPILR